MAGQDAEQPKTRQEKKSKGKFNKKKTDEKYTSRGVRSYELMLEQNLEKGRAKK